MNDIWEEIKDIIYRLNKSCKKIGFPPTEGSTGFYSGKLTKDEINEIDEFMKILNLDILNTRILKYAERHYGVLIASVNYS